jgi:hypothetical protein
MRGMSWTWEGLQLLTVGCALTLSLAATVGFATPTRSALGAFQRFSGVEIGNGEFVMGEGATEGEAGTGIALPSAVRNWKRRITDTYVELIAPTEFPSIDPTRLRISLKGFEQDDEQVKELEELGWRRFNWRPDVVGLRLERLYNRTRALRALEVKLFREAREASELVLIGNKKSPSFAAFYEWLTPKGEPVGETDKP